MSSRSTVGRPLLVGVVVVAVALVWSVGGPGLPGPHVVPVDGSAGVGMTEAPLEHGLEDDLLAEVRESTAHVHGLGCIAAQVGTGFVAGPDLVVTAAHVVAGLDAPIVDIGGVSTPSIVVAFDPRSDLAVLSTAVGLSPALPLADASAGQTVALVAYDDESGEAEALTTLDGLGHTVDRNQTIGEFGGCFLAVAAVTPAVFTFCHQAFLQWVAHVRAGFTRSLVAARLHRPGSSGRRERLPQIIRTSDHLRARRRPEP